MDPQHAVYKTLLESTRAIPWQIDWATARFTYIGPQIETLLGWSPSSWQTVDDWAERMHAEDRERVVNYCVSQSQAGVDHEADYRARTRDGSYVWIRDVVHVMRDEEGKVASLVGFMFDISERKRTEEQVERLQATLQALSFQDPLTGVANRRRFDAVLAHEWERARIEQSPLGLVLIDIDFFKQFNDAYGHVKGDACLRRVSELLARAMSRPRDFLARFGGEEFVLILPDSDLEAATRVADRCRALIAEDAIPHTRSAVGERLTVSAGVGSVVPADGDRAIAFVEEVDVRLYRAKQNGRDRVEADRGDAVDIPPSKRSDAIENR